MIKYKIKYFYYLLIFLLLIFFGSSLDNKYSKHDQIFYAEYNFVPFDKKSDYGYYLNHSFESLILKASNMLESLFPLDELISKEGVSYFYGANFIQNPFRCSIEFYNIKELEIKLILILDEPNIQNREICAKKISQFLKKKLSLEIDKVNKRIKGMIRDIDEDSIQFSLNEYINKLVDPNEFNLSSSKLIGINSYIHEFYLISLERKLLSKLYEVFDKEIFVQNIVNQEFKSKLEKKSVSSRHKFLILFIYIFVAIFVSFNFFKKKE